MDQNSETKISGYHIVLDNGSSKPDRGSLKVAVLADNTGELLFSTSNINDEGLKEVCSEGFTCSLDYVYGLASRIIQYIDLAKDKISQLSSDKRVLTGIVLLVPCQVVNNGTGIIANLIDRRGNKLTDVDWNLIPPKLRESGKVSMTDENNFKFVVANDICGAAAKIAQIMVNNTNYDNRIGAGFYATVVMAGGGCGGAHIRVQDEIIQIEAIEPGMARSFTEVTHIEGYGASSYAILNNFTAALGFNENTAITIRRIGNARIATQYVVDISRESYEINTFRDSGLFDEIKSDEKKIYFKLKNVTEKAHRKACKEAVDIFIDAVGQLAAPRVTDLVNLFILAGPIAAAMKNQVNTMEEYHGIEIEELIWEKTQLYLNPNTLFTAKSNGFKIKCESDIPDNTVGGSLLLKSKVIGKGLRGSWFNIPIREFKIASYTLITK